MRYVLRGLVVSVAAALLAVSAAAQDVTFVHATVIDGTGAPPMSDATVVVRAGKIAEVRRGAAGAPSGAMIDLQGRWLLPGFVDAHTHIATIDAAERALLSGVTTARVVGDAYLESLGIRDLIHGGYVRGPELLAAGPIIRPKPGVAFYVTFPQFGQYMNGELRGPATIAAAVRAVLDRGADVIKVGASERAGLASTDPRRQELTYEEIAAAVQEATKRGKFVAAHVHDAKGADAAVRAGVRSIEHGTYLTDETLRLMKSKGTFLVPTVAVMSPLGDPVEDGPDAVALSIRTHHMQAAHRGMVRRAKALGIPIAAATDGSYAERGEGARIRVASDIELMVRECGFTPLEAITAATQTGARVLGVDARTGTITAGKEADLLVFDRNPLQDVTALFEPLVVMSNGTLIQNRMY
jgi:imidazolonepropionase-like amidohydrolase